MILVGDCRERLRELPDGSVHTVITSPPYFGLRDYGTGQWDGGDEACDHLAPLPGGSAASGLGNYDNGLNSGTIAEKITQRRQQYRETCQRCGARRLDRQIGLEPTPEEFVAALVDVFREVRRVLRDDGTVWLNLGDSYSRSAGDRNGNYGRAAHGVQLPGGNRDSRRSKYAPIKDKDLLGIPWMVAFALRADGWYLRSEVVWSKPNPMPESVTDRPTSAHEKLFLLAKSPRYFYDADAIREAQSPASLADHLRRAPSDRANGVAPDRGAGDQGLRQNGVMTSGSRNRRNVWEIATQPFADAHFATFPPKLVEPCLLAGSPAQACADCGAPYERIIEGGESTWAARKAAGATWGNLENAASNGGTQRVVHGQGVSRDLTPELGRTVGFEPSCDCGAAAVPGTVLDPFAGSGTVGVVASWYGRDFVGIELNPAYAEMAERRIASEGRLGRRASKPEPAQAEALF